MLYQVQLTGRSKSENHITQIHKFSSLFFIPFFPPFSISYLRHFNENNIKYVGYEINQLDSVNLFRGFSEKFKILCNVNLNDLLHCNRTETVLCEKWQTWKRNVFTKWKQIKTQIELASIELTVVKMVLRINLMKF